MRERQRRVLQDLGIYRVAALKDLVNEHFGGHPFAARRAIDDLKRRGLVEEFQARGPRGRPFRVLYLTRKGRRMAERQRGERLDPDQRYWSGRDKFREAGHEAGVYRAGRKVWRDIEAQGGTVWRVRCDSELKAAVARLVEKARALHGREEAERVKREVAEMLGLPVVDGKVLYPDLQIEFRDAGGRTGRVNVEVATGNYRSREIARKQAAGFQMHAADGLAWRKLGLGGMESGGRGGGRDRDGGLLEL